MRILIVGEGGRESAIAAKLNSDHRVSQMYFARGNASTGKFGKNIDESDITKLRDIAIREKIDLTIVGPELPLVNGLVDEFQAHNLKVFGPRARAAKLEGSKAFSKKFMQTFDVKTAKAVVFESYELATEYITRQAYPLVIKASGLAGGKGVVICEDHAEAQATLDSFMIRKIYGDAGIQVIVEEYLQGFEASIMAFSNGKELFPCIPAKDYKKVGTGDTGANTGGMGSVAPSPEFTDAHWQDFNKNILAPTLRGLQQEKLEFKGIIFFGLMVTANGCYLLEYNMRFGDPETQSVLALMQNDLIDVIEDCLAEKPLNLKFRDEKAVTLVMCSGGYPGTITTDYVIHGQDKVKHSQILYAGAQMSGDEVVTTGGRVLNLVATGNTFEEARRKVYEDAHSIQFDYAFYREDIGKF